MEHLNDVRYFWDAIENFSFDYDFYTFSGRSVDEKGKVIKTFTHSTIRGSLQSYGGYAKSKDKSGATTSGTFKFFCKSIYKFNIDDFIRTQDGQWLICVAIDEPYSEWGVRAGSFQMTDLYHHKDLADYIKTLSGEYEI